MKVLKRQFLDVNENAYTANKNIAKQFVQEVLSLVPGFIIANTIETSTSYDCWLQWKTMTSYYLYIGTTNSRDNRVYMGIATNTTNTGNTFYVSTDVNIDTIIRRSFTALLYGGVEEFFIVLYNYEAYPSPTMFNFCIWGCMFERFDNPSIKTEGISLGANINFEDIRINGLGYAVNFLDGYTNVDNSIGVAKMNKLNVNGNYNWIARRVYGITNTAGATNLDILTISGKKYLALRDGFRVMALE